jgi:hypothetical protein
MTLSRSTPILRIFDEAKAKEFYVDFIGFSVDWEHRFGDNFPLFTCKSRETTASFIFPSTTGTVVQEAHFESKSTTLVL